MILALVALAACLEYEGLDPFREDHLEFRALDSRVLTANGHGYRNELKVSVPDRRDMNETQESLSAEITPFLSPGAKTIVVQYHEAGTGTSLKLYVDGSLRHQTFLVYARIKGEDGVERAFPLGQIASGQSFLLNLENDRGWLRLGVNGRFVEQRLWNSPRVYLKFGDYLQAQDPVTKEPTAHDAIPDFYPRHGIDQDLVIFRQVVYTRGGERDGDS